MHEIIPETLGQYTGLKDKNGNKIFDGDVVSIKHRITRNPHWGIPAEEKIIKVEYDNETLSYGLFETMQECKGALGEIVSVQVIGNKHDNGAPKTAHSLEFACSRRAYQLNGPKNPC